jgi:hypothetical protein
MAHMWECGLEQRGRLESRSVVPISSKHFTRYLW